MTGSTPEKRAERKLSTGSSSSPERRLRTRSFGEKSQMHVVREYVGDEMDKHLSARNLVKKAIAKDCSSVFRAVCEQISSVQTDHCDLRILVENILKPISRDHYAKAPETKFDRNRKIFEILSEITSSRINVHSTLAEEPIVYEGEEVEEGKEISVCESRQAQSVYEPVYSTEMHEALAISQAIIYRTLYEGVFGHKREEIDKAIDYIRADIDCHTHSTIEHMCMMNDNHMHAANAPCSHKAPIFPFCACKSLDPSIYRNVEYDLYRKKVKESEQASANSLAVKFGPNARCLIRDGSRTLSGTVIAVVKPDIRRIYFDDEAVVPRIREFHASDLRSLATPPIAHHSMQSLLSNVNGRGMNGGGGQMRFLPGCATFPPPPPLPPVPPPLPGMFTMPPPLMMGVPPPLPPPLFSPPLPLYGMQQRLSYGSDQPPPPPIEEEGENFSPLPVDSTLDSSVFTATPLSSRKEGEGRRSREKKPRALSAELADSPVAARTRRSDLTWWQPPKRETEGVERKNGGGRRATEGDGGGEMNRPLQPKQQLQHRLSTCSSQTESGESPALPSLMEAKLKKEEAPSGRAKLPSLLPLPPAQARASYYDSSEWTGDDTVFTADEGAASQMSLSNNSLQQLQQAPLAPPPTALLPPPLMFMPDAAAAAAAAVAEQGMASITVPHITMEQFEEVDKNADYSMNIDGSDFPDTLTTRFFYNLGLQFYRSNLEGGEVVSEDNISPPPAIALPMPPHFIVPSPSLPPPSPMFFPPNGPPPHIQYAMAGPAAPPPTPSFIIHPPVSLPHHLAQYCLPGVEGMPTYGFMNGRNGMEGDPFHPIPSPSIVADGSGNVFFPN